MPLDDASEDDIQDSQWEKIPKYSEFEISEPKFENIEPHIVSESQKSIASPVVQPSNIPSGTPTVQTRPLTVVTPKNPYANVFPLL